MIDAIATTAGLTPLGLLTVVDRTLWTLAALASLGIGLSKLGESLRHRRRHGRADLGNVGPAATSSFFAVTSNPLVTERDMIVGDHCGIVRTNGCAL